MSTPPSPFNPSRQVERIREILVGRQVAKLEERMDRLEHCAPTPSAGHAPASSAEPRIEQLRANLHAQSQAIAAEINRLDHRVGALEQSPPAGLPAGSSPPDPRIDRLDAALAAESTQRRAETAALAARIQAAADTLGSRFADLSLQQSSAAASLRAEFQTEANALHRKVEDQALRRAEDLRELTARIEEVARRASADPLFPDQSSPLLDPRLVGWIQSWQDQLARYLQGREQQLVHHLREELRHLRDSNNQALADLRLQKADRSEWHERMSKVAAAARALADSANLAAP